MRQLTAEIQFNPSALKCRGAFQPCSDLFYVNFNPDTLSLKPHPSLSFDHPYPPTKLMFLNFRPCFLFNFCILTPKHLILLNFRPCFPRSVVFGKTVIENDGELKDDNLYGCKKNMRGEMCRREQVGDK